MDPSNNNWTAAENKAFEVAMAEVDRNSSDWFEQLMTRFPNKTPQQIRDRYVDLVVDIECNESGHLPNPIYSDPWAESMSTEIEGLSTLQVPYSPQFSEIELMSSRIGSVSMPEKKAEEEGLLLLADKGENEASLLEELMKDGFFEPMDEWWMKESSHQVVGQERPVPEVEVLKILSPGIVEGGNTGLPPETKEKAVMSSEVAVKVQSGKQVLKEVSGVAVERKVAEKPEILASRKGKYWTKEEHRLFLTGLNIYGRGAWKKIANNFVHTRTQTQVASHAQKYFQRQSNPRQKLRHSILDITTFTDIKIPRQTSMYNTVDWNSQTRVNNVNQPGPSSIPLLPMSMANYTHIVKYPQFSQLALPDNLERNNNELGFKWLRSPNQTNSVQHRMHTDAMNSVTDEETI